MAAADEVVANRLACVVLIDAKFASGVPGIFAVDPNVKEFLERVVLELQRLKRHHALGLLEECDKLVAGQLSILAAQIVVHTLDMPLDRFVTRLLERSIEAVANHGPEITAGRRTDEDGAEQSQPRSVG